MASLHAHAAIGKHNAHFSSACASCSERPTLSRASRPRPSAAHAITVFLTSSPSLAQPRAFRIAQKYGLASVVHPVMEADAMGVSGQVSCGVPTHRVVVVADVPAA